MDDTEDCVSSYCLEPIGRRVTNGAVQELCIHAQACNSPL